MYVCMYTNSPAYLSLLKCCGFLQLIKILDTAAAIQYTNTHTKATKFQT